MLRNHSRFFAFVTGVSYRDRSMKTSLSPAGLMFVIRRVTVPLCVFCGGIIRSITNTQTYTHTRTHAVAHTRRETERQREIWQHFRLKRTKRCCQLVEPLPILWQQLGLAILPCLFQQRQHFSPANVQPINVHKSPLLREGGRVTRLETVTQKHFH